MSLSLIGIHFQICFVYIPESALVHLWVCFAYIYKSALRASLSLLSIHLRVCFAYIFESALRTFLSFYQHTSLGLLCAHLGVCFAYIFKSALHTSSSLLCVHFRVFFAYIFEPTSVHIFESALRTSSSLLWVHLWVCFLYIFESALHTSSSQIRNGSIFRVIRLRMSSADLHGALGSRFFDSTSSNQSCWKFSGVYHLNFSSYHDLKMKMTLKLESEIRIKGLFLDLETWIFVFCVIELVKMEIFIVRSWRVREKRSMQNSFKTWENDLRNDRLGQKKHTFCHTGSKSPLWLQKSGLEPEISAPWPIFGHFGGLL